MRRSKAHLLLYLTLPVIIGGGPLRISSAATIEPETAAFLEQFHGHTCAGSLMGMRLGLAAKAKLEALGGEGKLQAKYFDNTCPVDGIQVAAGTTCGNRALEVVDQNEKRLLLTAKNGRQVEARLTTMAAEKGNLSRELAKKARALPADSPQRKELEREVDFILAWFKNAPDEEVVVIRGMYPP